jgi:hypothetical protein
LVGQQATFGYLPPVVAIGPNVLAIGADVIQLGTEKVDLRLKQGDNLAVFGGYTSVNLRGNLTPVLVYGRPYPEKFDRFDQPSAACVLDGGKSPRTNSFDDGLLGQPNVLCGFCGG